MNCRRARDRFLQTSRQRALAARAASIDGQHRRSFHRSADLLANELDEAGQGVTATV
jgi:hypothetical protein